MRPPCRGCRRHSSRGGSSTGRWPGRRRPRCRDSRPRNPSGFPRRRRRRPSSRYRCHPACRRPCRRRSSRELAPVRCTVPGRRRHQPPCRNSGRRTHCRPEEPFRGIDPSSRRRRSACRRCGRRRKSRPPAVCAGSPEVRRGIAEIRSAGIPVVAIQTVVTAGPRARITGIDGAGIQIRARRAVQHRALGSRRGGVTDESNRREERQSQPKQDEGGSGMSERSSCH